MAIQRFSPVVGGGELQLERLLPYLGARGIRARVLTRSAPGSPRRDLVGGCEVRRSPLGGEGPAASLTYVASSLAGVLRNRRDTDVVHAHGALSPATIALAASLFGIPAVVTPLGAGSPGDLNRLRSKPGGRLRLRLLVRRAHFVALSNELAGELAAAGVPADRIHLAPNGFDRAQYRPADPDERRRLRVQLPDVHGLAADRFVGVFVGRLHPVKNVDTLLGAVAKTPDVDLLIVGDGPDRSRLEARAHDLGLGSRARFLGMRADVADVLRACDAFFLPSHGEGLSNALIEAMGCGLACVVASAVGGATELVGSDRGMTVPAGAVDAWAAAIEHLAHDPAARATIGENASRFVHESFSLDHTADLLADLYRRLSPER
jgi:glycosyltransferase involved in cell wall biosynthesis